MTISPPLDQELDIRKVTVKVNSVEIQHRAGREVGGVTVMAPDDVGYETRIADVGGTFVGWRSDVPPEDTGASGMISVLIGSPSAKYLTEVASKREVVDIVIASNGSGLGFKTQTLKIAKFSLSPLAVEVAGVRMFAFVGWGYEEVQE